MCALQDIDLPGAEAIGSRMKNNIYRIPGTSREVSIRDAAYFFVGEVLASIDGRVYINDVIHDINEAFLEHNPGGWVTTNPHKRSKKDGGFTVAAIRKIGKAPPPASAERWAMKPTFRVVDKDEMVLLDVDSDNDETQ